MTEVRTIFHRAEGVQPRGLGEAISAEGYAEFYDGPVEASQLAFTLSRVGIAILVRDDNGRRIGVFADPARAVAHGFDRFDRPRRVRRRTT